MPVSDKAIKQIGRMLLGRYAAAGWLPTRAVNRLQTLGYTWRTQDMFRDFHRFQTSVARGKAIVEFPKHWKPTKGLMEEVHLRRAKKYWIIGKEYYWDEVKEEYVSKAISWYTSKSLSLEEWIDDYITNRYPNLYPGQPVPLSVDIVDIRHNEGFPY